MFKAGNALLSLSPSQRDYSSSHTVCVRGGVVGLGRCSCVGVVFLRRLSQIRCECQLTCLLVPGDRYTFGRSGSIVPSQGTNRVDV